MFSYLSWSKYNTYVSSRKAFINRYIYNYKLQSKYLDFGKLIAEGLEDRDVKTKSECVKWARKVIPCPAESEKEYFVNFNGVPLFGKLDGDDPDTIHEYKTGKKPWTQKMVDNHGQLTFYAIFKFLKTGKLPKKILLYWLPTYDDVDGSVKLAQIQPTVFETTRTMSDIALMIPKLKRVWKEINSLKEIQDL